MFGSPFLAHNYIAAGDDELATGPLHLYARQILGTSSPLNTGNNTYDSTTLGIEASIKNNLQLIGLPGGEHFAYMDFRLPATGIVDTGGTNILIGTRGHDFIDANPGMMSRMNTGKHAIAIDDSPIPRPHSIVLVEGHLHTVQSSDGNDTIITTGKGGAQHVEPGKGTNDVQVFYPKTGQITIKSEGNDTLTFSQDALRGKKLQAQQEGNNIVLHFDHHAADQQNAFVRLIDQVEGKGVKHLRVLGEKGTVLAEFDTSKRATAEQWQDALNLISHVCNTNQLGAATIPSKGR